MPAIVNDLITRLEQKGRRDDVRSSIISHAGNSLFTRGSLEKTLKGLLSGTGEEGEEGVEGDLDDLLTEKLFRAAGAHIETLLAAIDVQAMVRDRINSMDMLRVEGIILDVMANQFKWIDIFGAILGFLIGLFQALFAWGMNT
jgi:uncharacterized membrane protein YheB (UPF0754 family)